MYGITRKFCFADIYKKFLNLGRPTYLVYYPTRFVFSKCVTLSRFITYLNERDKRQPAAM